MMNLAIRAIEGDLGPEHPDTFRRDLHKDLKADYVLANPPFNDSDGKPTTPQPIALLNSIESPQRKPQWNHARMRRFNGPLQIPISL